MHRWLTFASSRDPGCGKHLCWRPRFQDAIRGGVEAPKSSLSPAQRARGRRLAIRSHPMGMTHRLVYTDQLPTLALVALGASETLVGVQRALEPLAQLFQLTTLRVLRSSSKRKILVAGQILAVLAGLPLIAFSFLEQMPQAVALTVVLASLAVTAIGIVVSQTVWFPLLRTYVEAGQTGQFFGALRTGWQLLLVVYFLVAQQWLMLYPGAFGALFAIGTLCGVLRIGMIARLPEAPTAAAPPSRVRAALRLLRSEPRLRHYLLGVSLCGAARRAVLPFVIVLMRRLMGLSDADVLLGTVAIYIGGAASLYLWGKVTDRLGALPVFRLCAVVTAALYLALLPLAGSSPGAVEMAVFFLLTSVFFSGFGVADTHVLFRLATAHEPTGFLVVADVVSSLAYGLAPLLIGVLLDAAIGAGAEPLLAYRIVFSGAAVATVASIWPLRVFRD